MPDSSLRIWRSARVLVDQHGDEAAIHAAMRADTMLDQGDLDGYVVWRRVVRANALILSFIVHPPVRIFDCRRNVRRSFAASSRLS